MLRNDQNLSLPYVSVEEGLPQVVHHLDPRSPSHHVDHAVRVQVPVWSVNPILHHHYISMQIRTFIRKSTYYVNTIYIYMNTTYYPVEGAPLGAELEEAEDGEVEAVNGGEAAGLRGEDIGT